MIKLNQTNYVNSIYLRYPYAHAVGICPKNHNMVTSEIIKGDKVRFVYKGYRYTGVVNTANKDIVFIQTDRPINIDGEKSSFFYINKRYVKKIRKTAAPKFGQLK